MRKLRDWVKRMLGQQGTRRLLGGAGLAAATLVCGIAHAESAPAGHHGEPHVNLWSWDAHAPPTGWFLIDFVIFVGLLYFLGKGPVTRAFQNRHDAIKQAIERAQAAYAKAKAHADEYGQKLARVVQEVEVLVAGARRSGEEEKERIVATAEEAAGKMQADTQAVVEQEIDGARRRLREEVVAEVLGSARAILTRELSDADRERLLEQAISDLENGAHELQGSLEVVETAP
jgi:F-type H+-transporting ATPase subunit b